MGSMFLHKRQSLLNHQDGHNWSKESIEVGRGPIILVNYCTACGILRLRPDILNRLSIDEKYKTSLWSLYNANKSD